MSRKERLEIHEFEQKNALRYWTEFSGVLETSINVLVLELSRFLPLGMKNMLLRSIGMDVGRNASIGLKAMFDIFFPGKISIGENTTIGYNATILAHEATRNEFRIGSVEIGEDVLIGANATVLPGVRIGDGAKVAANSLVNRDVEEDEFVGGVPIETID